MASRKASPVGLFHFFRRFRGQIFAEKRLLALSFAGVVGEVAMRLLEPWPLKFVIDHVLDPAKASRTLHPWFEGASPLTLVTLSAIAIVTFGALRALFAYANTVGLALVGNRVLTQVRGDLYRHLQALSLSYHHRTRNGPPHSHDVLGRRLGRRCFDVLWHKHCGNVSEDASSR